MSDKSMWGKRIGVKSAVAAEDSEGDGYKPWVTGQGGFARDLIFFPAKGSGEKTRFEPLVQAITIELSEDATRLGLLGHSTGQIIFIEGRGLDDLAMQISAKRVNSVHVWDASQGAQPQGPIVTAVSFQRSIEDMVLKDE